MIDRRTALQITAALVGCTPERAGAQVQHLVSRIRLNPHNEEIIELDFGAGAYGAKTVRLTQGAISVDIAVADLLAALGARTQP